MNRLHEKDLLQDREAKSNLTKPTDRDRHYDRHRSHRSRSRDNLQRRKNHQEKTYKEKKNYHSSSSSSDSSSSSSSYSYSGSRSHSDSRRSDSQKSVKIIRSGSTQRRRNCPHYRYQRGEKIGHKYWVKEILGDGTFGRVLKGEYNHKTYAIKIIKPVQKYIKSAKIERDILKQINQKDPNDQNGIVRVIESFYHRNHFCIVLEQLGSSLYDLIKKNKYKGFPRTVVKKFFYQILKSLAFVHRVGYTHTDLKPENILLVKDDFEIRREYRGVQKYYYPLNTRLSIIDFGSATKYNQHHSSIINTRQYRSPEVLLECCKWNELSDVWSIGCIIVELYTGNLLFDTHQDHQHLAMIAKNSGTFPSWMIKDCDNDLNEIFTSKGKIKEHKLRKYVREGENIVYMKTVMQIFEHDQKLKNLLQKCLQIDPKKRISCEEALKDQYFKDYSI